MSKVKAVRVDHLGDMPLDIPDTFLRVEPRQCLDGTSYLYVAE